jgi:hypothetical protein
LYTPRGAVPHFSIFFKTKKLMTTESIHSLEVTEKKETSVPASPPAVNVWTMRSQQTLTAQQTLKKTNVQQDNLSQDGFVAVEGKKEKKTERSEKTTRDTKVESIKETVEKKTEPETREKLNGKKWSPARVNVASLH